MPTPRLRLGQLLVDARLITSEALEEVLAVQRTDGRRLGTLLVERGLINETQLTQILSHQLSVPWVSLLHIEFSRQLLNLVPRDVADRYCLVPIYVRHVRNQGETLYVAMEDPSNEDGLRACREHSGLPVRSMIAPPADIRSAIRVYYGVESQPAPSAARKEPVPRTEPSPSPAAAEPPRAAEPAAPAATAAPSPAVTAAPSPIAPMEATPIESTTLPSAASPLAATPPPQVEVVTREETPAPPEGGDISAEAIAAQATSTEVVTGEGTSQASSEPGPARSVEGPEIEAVEIPVDLSRAERLRGILEPPLTPPPPSSPQVENIPRPRGRAPRMVSLTLLDGTTINLPAKRRARRNPGEAETRDAVQPEAPAPAAYTSSLPPGTSDFPAAPMQGLTARDLVLALRVVANGADASEVLGENIRWESLFSALLSLMLKKHIIADWEFVDELKKQL